MNPPDDQPNSLDRHFDDYVDGALAPVDGEEFSAWLQASEANVDRFVRESFLHWQLFDIVRRRDLHADVMATPFWENTAAKTLQGVHADSLRPDLASRSANASRRSRRFVALAASLMLAIGAAVWAYVATRPVAVAQLTKATADVSFEGVANSPSVGTLLYEGQSVRLTRGRLLATLVSGTRVIVEAPAELSFTAENKIQFVRGRLGAEVPTQATGFSVQTPLGEVLDLGTEYTLDLPTDRRCEIHVFAGMVELRPAGGRPVRVSEGTAISYDAASDKETLLPYDEEERLSL